MDAYTLAHTDDPDVSKLAAINLSGHATEQIMHVVIDMLAEHGPMTPAELEHRYFQYRERWNWPVVAFYSIHRRVSQMKKHVHVLVPVGRRDGAQLLNLATNPTQAHADITAYFSGDEAGHG